MSRVEPESPGRMPQFRLSSLLLVAACLSFLTAILMHDPLDVTAVCECYLRKVMEAEKSHAIFGSSHDPLLELGKKAVPHLISGLDGRTDWGVTLIADKLDMLSFSQERLHLLGGTEARLSGEQRRRWWQAWWENHSRQSEEEWIRQSLTMLANLVENDPPPKLEDIERVLRLLCPDVVKQAAHVRVRLDFYRNTLRPFKLSVPSYGQYDPIRKVWNPPR